MDYENEDVVVDDADEISTEEIISTRSIGPSSELSACTVRRRIEDRIEKRRYIEELGDDLFGEGFGEFA